MVRPLFSWIFLEHSEAGRPAVRCRCKSGIFLGKWHKKLAGRRGKHYGLVFLITVQATSSSAKIGFSSPAVRPAFSLFTAQGTKMSNRSWFYASNGQQQGPYPEAQLRDLITRGMVGADTLVWTEGMSGWQRAGEIPGLVPGGSAPPPLSHPDAPPPMAGGDYAGGYAGGVLSADLPLWPLLGRSLLFVIGMLLIIPAPWTATGFYRWMVSRLYVPGRPNMGFTGQPLDIWYVFIAIGVLTYIGSADLYYLQYLSIPIQALLSWMIIRWIAANLSSNGQQLPISFDGNALHYIGWQVLLYVSFITIIGWAWVITAWMRWICRNINGTHREVIFLGSGLEVLWRSIVFGIACIFIIPIPWVLRWYANWYVSQFALADRTA